MTWPNPHQEEGVLEPNDQEVDWREVAFLSNGANEILTEKIHKQDKEFAGL